MNRILYTILFICLILVAASDLFLFYHNKKYSRETINESFEPITSKYGIKIVYDVGDGFFSNLVNPGIPAGPDPRSKVTPIRHRVLLQYPNYLNRAFSRYPDHVVKNYLNGIHFANEIDQGGFKYSGAYDPFRRIVYLVDDGQKTDSKAIRTFHHEFSSLLMVRHSFLINPWTDQNPDDFEYLCNIYDSWDEIDEMYAISNQGPEQYQMGFVTAYGQTNFENDFNEYSAMIFTYPDKFKKIMQQYPRIRGKFQFWLKFYQKIDPVFTEAYLLGSN